MKGLLTVTSGYYDTFKLLITCNKKKKDENASQLVEEFSDLI